MNAMQIIGQVCAGPSILPISSNQVGLVAHHLDGRQQGHAEHEVGENLVVTVHALGGGEDAGSAGSGYAVPRARSHGASADADDQRAAKPLGGVRRGRAHGASSCRSADSGAASPRL